MTELEMLQKIYDMMTGIEFGVAALILFAVTSFVFILGMYYRGDK